jgi:hypothetical protein
MFQSEGNIRMVNGMKHHENVYIKTSTNEVHDGLEVQV